MLAWYVISVCVVYRKMLWLYYIYCPHGASYHHCLWFSTSCRHCVLQHYIIRIVYYGIMANYTLDHLVIYNCAWYSLSCYHCISYQATMVYYIMITTNNHNVPWWHDSIYHGNKIKYSSCDDIAYHDNEKL